MLIHDPMLQIFTAHLYVLFQIFYVNSVDGDEDIVVLNPQWLCHDVIGYLLSHDVFSQCRPTGLYTATEVQLMFPETDGVRLLHLLELLEVCIPFSEFGDSELEYEFPCYNVVELEDHVADIKRKALKVNWIFGGIRICASNAFSPQLSYVFCRLQSQLRRRLPSILGFDCALYQRYGGSWYQVGDDLYTLVSVAVDGRSIDIKCRVSADLRIKCHQFCTAVTEQVVIALESCMPGIVIEQQALSPAHLAENATLVHAFSPKDIRSSGTAAVLLKNSSPSAAETAISDEDLCEMFAFGSQDVFYGLVPGMSLPISSGILSYDARRRLARMLDPLNTTGRDWCLLAVWLGINAGDLATFDSEKSKVSPTDRIISKWSQTDAESATVSALINKLQLLGRHDAASVLMDSVPLFGNIPPKPLPKTHVFFAAQSQSYDSDLTVSSTVSR
jgi:death-associated protein kinase